MPKFHTRNLHPFQIVTSNFHPLPYRPKYGQKREPEYLKNNTINGYKVDIKSPL